MENSSTKSRLIGYFCSDIAFSLTYKSIIEAEIKILEKYFEEFSQKRVLSSTFGMNQQQT